MVNNKRGRPSGGSDARQRLIDAASELFLRDGYTRTTIRSIAKTAGVDHALVNYHFGSKGELFTVVMDLLASPGRLVDHVAGQGVEYLVPRLLNALLTTWDRPEVQERSRRLLSALQSDRPTQVAFRGYVEAHVTTRLVDLLDGPNRQARAAAATSVINGLFLTRYVVRIEPLASMGRADVVTHLGPALHACLHPPHTARRVR
ncbi:TetR/AcrR family transcriptional regulator [Prauserella cavernicola]|uniref:TetR family transcriptional regulator n=1 Tax=Prauserella cavernicola TaxID=2800127 RepID=A0A934V7D1_9PSEU|nr:TetR family transcriptional regulator [Prauserella cavernicola]MBK1786613.1 TetR family transcriptional regulator [Prauserella cavernicola]